MKMTNTQLYNLAKTYLGKGGAIFRKYCGLGKNDPYCNAFVTYVFYKGGDALLYCGGKKMVYCPTSIKWCYNNLANIPPYLAMPMDVVYFDWNLNGVPDHVGFAAGHQSDQVLPTIEGNTNGGIVANKSRNTKYVRAVFRPHFKPAFKNAKLEVDGHFGYNSIAMLQKALGLELTGILDKDTVKALQKRAGVTQDGSWGKGTSKAVQKLIGVTQDGYFGVKSVKALQEWINKEAFTKPNKACDEADKLVAKKFGYCSYDDDHGEPENCGNCIRFDALCWKNAGINVDASQDGLLTDGWANKLYQAALKSKKTALEMWEKRNGKGYQIIWNDGKQIPITMLKPGDSCLCFKGSGYKHTALKHRGIDIADCNSGTGAQIRPYSKLNNPCKMAFRYIGK